MSEFKRDDIVIEEGCSSTFFLVLTCGPKTFDLIEQCGGTTRYRHDQGRHIRLATPRDYGDDAYGALVRKQLEREASNARAERRNGERVRRGHVSPSRGRKVRT